MDNFKKLIPLAIVFFCGVIIGTYHPNLKDTEKIVNLPDLVGMMATYHQEGYNECRKDLNLPPMPSI